MPIDPGPIAARRDDMIARVADAVHGDPADEWLAAGVDAAVEFAIVKTNRELVGLPDDPLTVDGVVVLAQRIYLDAPGGANVAVGDPSFGPIYQPEDLWKHARHYFDRLDVAWGVG